MKRSKIAYRKRHPEQHRAEVKRWRKKNPHAVREHSKRKKLQKRGVLGTHTHLQWEELKELFNHCCIGCGMQEPFTDQYYQFLTEDHIVPVSKGGNNNISNIQPMCHRCNSSKGTKT